MFLLNPFAMRGLPLSRKVFMSLCTLRSGYGKIEEVLPRQIVLVVEIRTRTMLRSTMVTGKIISLLFDRFVPFYPWCTKGVATSYMLLPCKVSNVVMLFPYERTALLGLLEPLYHLVLGRPLLFGPGSSWLHDCLYLPRWLYTYWYLAGKRLRG